MSRPASLRLRVTLLLAGSVAGLACALAAATHLFVAQRLRDSFDALLRANAEAIAALVVEDPGDEEPIELELSEEVVPRLSRASRPDLFAVFLADGSVLRVSRSPGALPEWAGHRQEPLLLDFAVGGEPYRAILLPTRAQVDDPPPGAPALGGPITVLYASSRHDLERDLGSIQAFLLLAVGATGLLAAAAASWVARGALRPLEALAREATGVDARSLDHRFASGQLPSDLAPLADSLNGLLARLAGSFERERRFSAEAAHELRTPVAVLKSGIQAALLSPVEPARDREALEELLEDVQRLESLCESLLEASRDEALGPPPTLPRDVLLQELRATVDAFEPLARRRGARLELDPGPEAGTGALVHPGTVRRVLSNLLDNALRHGGEGVRVQVRLEGVDAPVLVVEDDGPGIPAGLRPRLFERFARGDESRSRATGGAGLGLAICRSLAERDGGSLELDSPAGQRGARFLWRLPPAPPTRTGDDR